MVAYTGYCDSFSFRDIAYRGVFFGVGSVYLFVVLAMKISKERQSVIAIVAGFLVIAWIKHSYTLLIAGAAVAVAFPFPVLYKRVHRFWMLISKVLGWISSHIILSILFYLFLTPIALLRRVMGKRDMKVLLENEESGFYERNHVYAGKDFLNPW